MWRKIMLEKYAKGIWRKKYLYRDRWPMHCLNKDNDEIIETNYEAKKDLKRLLLITSNSFTHAFWN